MDYTSSWGRLLNYNHRYFIRCHADCCLLGFFQVHCLYQVWFKLVKNVQKTDSLLEKHVLTAHWITTADELCVVMPVSPDAKCLWATCAKAEADSCSTGYMVETPLLGWLASATGQRPLKSSFFRVANRLTFSGSSLFHLRLSKALGLMRFTTFTSVAIND